MSHTPNVTALANDNPRERPPGDDIWVNCRRSLVDLRASLWAARIVVEAMESALNLTALTNSLMTRISTRRVTRWVAFKRLLELVVF